MPRRGGRRLSGGAGGGGGRVHPGHVLSHNRVQATMHNWGQVSLAVSTLGLASFEVFQACKQEHLHDVLKGMRNVNESISGCCQETFLLARR